MKTAVLCILFCAAAAPASAQMKWTDKGFVNVNFGIESGSHDLNTAFSFALYGETAEVSGKQRVDADTYFDVSGGYKVWRNLAVGIGISRATSDSDVAFTGRIPDPLHFDRPRDITATATGASHSQTGIHLNGTWMVPVTDKIDVALSFGPTIFNVSQEVPTAVSVGEPGPTLSSITLTETSETAVGVNVGVDVTYLLTKRVGVGGVMRFSRGSVELPGTTNSLTLGGFVIGAGARLRF